MSHNDKLPAELVSAIHDIYEPAGMKLTQPVLREAESFEYGACRFALNKHPIVFRIAKTTPTKIGQFVTLWKRPRAGDEIAPFDINDEIDFVMIHVSDQTQSGQFIFDRKVLAKKGVFSKNAQGGKRAIRVYPPWSAPLATQAIKTQQWQLPYFFPFNKEEPIDLEKLRELFSGS